MAVWRGQAEAVHAYAFGPPPASVRIALTDDLTGGSHAAMGGRDPSGYLTRWRELAGADVAVQPLPASHLGVMAAPHVRRLADYLNEWIEELPS